MGDVDTDHVRRRFPPLALWIRQTLSLAIVAIMAATVIAIAVDIALRDAAEEQLAAHLEANARLVAVVADLSPLDPTGQTERIELDARLSRIATRLDAQITIVDADNMVIGGSSTSLERGDRLGVQPEIIAARERGVGVAKREYGALNQESLFAAVPVPEANGVVVRVHAPVAGTTAGIWRRERVLIATLLTAMALVVMVGAVAAKHVAGPLDAVRRQAGAMARGTYEVVPYAEAPREPRELGRSLNIVAGRHAKLKNEHDHAQARLDVTLSGLSDGVVITDGRGVVLRLNAAAGELLGASGHHGVGQPFVQLARDYELATLLRQALTEPTVRRRAATVQHGRGQRILYATAQRIDTAGDRFGLVVLRDETELRRLEQVRREFVANVSHELRTPLTSIKALVETLDAGAIDDPAVAGNFLHRIVGEVDRLAALVDELLDLARLESGRVTLQPEPLEAADLLRHGLERVRAQTERARLSLHLDVEPDLPAVRADRQRMEQVLLNLIHNAIKFTPPGGTIRVTAEVVGQELKVSVADTGEGVAPEELPRLFERFYKADKARRSEGTGLGLAIAKHIVQAHGGTIGVESPPGEGATFSFTLPLAAGEGDDPVSAPTARHDATTLSALHIP